MKRFFLFLFITIFCFFPVIADDLDDSEYANDLDNFIEFDDLGDVDDFDALFDDANYGFGGSGLSFDGPTKQEIIPQF